jgi:hypothetical protein
MKQGGRGLKEGWLSWSNLGLREGDSYGNRCVGRETLHRLRDLFFCLSAGCFSPGPYDRQGSDNLSRRLRGLLELRDVLSCSLHKGIRTPAAEATSTVLIVRRGSRVRGFKVYVAIGEK